MTVFHSAADWLDGRPARVPRRSPVLRARDLAGVALVAVWAMLTVLFLTVVL